jgi:signal transduction histidine kinase
MSQTIYHAYEAILQGLVDEVEATAATLVLADGAAESPHVLAQVGRLTTAGWARQLKECPSDIFVQPLSSTAETTALLGVHAAGQTCWSDHQRSLIRAAARSIECLSGTNGDEVDWRQVVASHRILTVTEEELCRIVLDIHDGPVQKIFAALNHLTHLQHLAERHECPPLTSLPQITQLLETAMAEIRTFLGAFRPPEFNQRALLDIIEGLIIQHEELTDTTVHLKAETELPEVAPPVKIALYRIVQEALANSVRHAGVQEHFIHLWLHRGDIYLEVIDFGRGFDPPDLTGPDATERAEHIGLRGMRDRVQLIGGKFELSSRPGHGTRIRVCVPCYA